MSDLDQLREKLNSTREPLSRIALAAGVKGSWLRMFARGDIPDPSYTRIQAIRAYFEAQQTAKKPASAAQPEPVGP